MLARVTFAAVALLLFPLTALAAHPPLADKVPADAVMYIGWGGADAMGPEYKASHLKAVIDATDWRHVFDQFLPKLAERVGTTDPNGAKVVEAFSTLGEAMWRHRSAIYFAGIDFTDPKNPQPQLAILVDAGDQNPKLADKLGGLMKVIHQNEKPPVPMQIKNYGAGPVALVIGNLPESFDAMLGGPQAVAPGKSLAQNDAFTKSVASLHKSPAAAIYMNGEAFVKQIDAGVAASGDRDATEMWPKIRDGLGLAGFKQFTWAGGFDGKDWSSAAFLAAPKPRAGLLALLDGKPVPDDMLKRIPATATMLGCASFDISSALTEIRKSGSKIDPQIGGAIDGGLGMASGMLGMDMQKDLLDPMGDQWAYYVDPTVGGSSLVGITLINRLEDAAKFDESLNQFEQALNGLLKTHLERQKITIEIRTRETNGIKLHYAALPLVTPAWTIKDGHLYAALYPQVVVAAASHDAAKGKSILDNPSFAAVRKRLGGGANVSSIQYLDLPKIAPSCYPFWLVISRYIGFADMFGVESPLMLIPPMPELMPHLAPAGSVTWADDAGWHMRHVSPFPGSEVFGSDPMSNLMIGPPAMMVSVLLPSLNRARETANRVKCASNMRQIGQACLLYANENKGKYPPDLGSLVLTQDIGAEVFTCPSTTGDLPPEIRTAPVEKQAAWVNANAHYVYVGAGRKFDIPPDTIILYEKPDNHDRDGMNFLYGDGHVEFQLMPVAEHLIGEAGGGGGAAHPQQPQKKLPTKGGL